jgi:hypothetical protein
MTFIPLIPIKKFVSQIMLVVVLITIFQFLLYQSSPDVLAQSAPATTTPTTEATTSPTTETSSGLQVIGFANCSPESADVTAGSEAIIECLKSVLNFVFVVAIFIAAFKFAAAGLGNYLPGSNVDAITEGKKAINGVVIGLVLMGLPGLILNLINPAANLLDFLGGLTIAGQQQPTPTDGNVGTGGGGGIDNPAPANQVTVTALTEQDSTVGCILPRAEKRYKIDFTAASGTSLSTYQCNNEFVGCSLAVGVALVYNTSSGRLSCPRTT